MKRFNKERFNENLLTQPLEQIVLKSDTDSMRACWKELFLNVLDKHAPIQPLWFNAAGNWDVYKTSRNRVDVALRHEKAYLTKAAHQKNNPKEAWKQLLIY